MDKPLWEVRNKLKSVENSQIKRTVTNSHDSQKFCSIDGIRPSTFEMKWKESISWSRLNITNQTEYKQLHHLKF